MPDLDPFQVAALRASSSFSDDAWNRLDAAERSWAICQELRRLDAEEFASRRQPGPAKPEKASTKRTPRQTINCRMHRVGHEASDPPTTARGAKTYRVVVRPNQSGTKSYRWEIVNDNTDVVIRRSPERYKTMEQAYDCGAAELATFSRAGQPRHGRADSIVTDKEHYGLPRLS